MFRLSEPLTDPKVQCASASFWCSAPSARSESASKLCSHPIDSPAPPEVPGKVEPLPLSEIRSMLVEGAAVAAAAGAIRTSVQKLAALIGSASARWCGALSRYRKDRSPRPAQPAP